MAVFNPNVPDINAPDYYRLSHPASMPRIKADTSTGEALSGLGDLFESGSKAAATYEIEKAGEEARTQIEPLERQRIQELQAVAQGVKKTETKPLGYAEEDSGLPGEAAAELARFGNVVGARNNGKISQTQYYGQLDKIASSLRSRYPGFKDEIDAKISQLTGVRPANALAQSLISDINAAQTASNYDLHQAVGLAKNFGYVPWVRDNIEGIMGGKVPFAQVFKNVYPFMVADQNHKVRQQQSEELKNNQALQKENAEEQVRESVNDTTNAWLSTIPEPPTDSSNAQAQQEWGQQVETARLKAYQDSQRKLFEKTPGSDYYPAKYAANWKTQLDNGMAVFDQLKNRAFDEKSGLVHVAKRFVEAQRDNFGKEMFGNKDFGQYMLMFDFLKAHAPDAAAEWLKQAIGITPGLPEAAKKMALHLQKLEMMNNNIQNPNSPQTLRQTFESVAGAGGKPRHFDEVIRWADDIADRSKPFEQREALARGLFDPKEVGFINSVAPDYYDEAGNYHPGKYSVYRNLTNPAVSDGMWDLGQKKPELWNNYRNYVEGTSRQLFVTEMKDLSNIATSPNTGLRWDTENARFHMEVKQNGRVVEPRAEEKRGSPVYSTGAPIVEPTAFKARQQAVNRINTMLGTLQGMAKHDPSIDVQSYLLRTMMDMGLDIRDPNTIQGLPGEIVKALTEHKVQQKKMEEEKAKMEKRKKPE